MLNTMVLIQFRGGGPCIHISFFKNLSIHLLILIRVQVAGVPVLVDIHLLQFFLGDTRAFPKPTKR